METSTPHIFISYARADGAEVAQWVAEALERQGYPVWMDRQLHADKDFSAEIERAIRAASHVVVCGTADIEREDSFVRREIRFAQALDKPIVPLLLPGGYLPIIIFNNTYIDFADRGAGFERLVQQLGVAQRPKPAVAPAADAGSLAGKYRLNGTNAGQEGIYTGTMVITGEGPHYQITWDTGMTLQGHGLRLGDVLAAVYLETYSVAVYEIEAEGRLNGLIVDKTAGTRGRETLTPRGSMQGISGEYDVHTVTENGQDVQGSLKLQPLGRRAAGLGGLFGSMVQVAGMFLLTFSWAGNPQPVQGVGFVVGQKLVVGYPGEPHGLIGYRIQPDGSLVGNWFGPGESRMGTENAHRI